MSLRIEKQHSIPENATLSKSSAPRAPRGIGAFATVLQNSTEESSESSTLSMLKNIPKILRELYISLLQTILGILEKLLSKAQGESSTEDTSTDMSWELPTVTETLSTISGEVVTTAVPVLPKDDAFDQLTIGKEQPKKIYFIIHTLAESHRQSYNVFSLGLALTSKKSKLAQLGEEIADVHPLKFLEYTLLHPQLAKDMKTLQDANSMLTWNPFVKGLATNLNKELDAARLLPCIEGFGRTLNIDPVSIRPYVEKREWEQMAKFLIDARLNTHSLPKPTAHVMPISTSTARPSIPLTATVIATSSLPTATTISTSLPPQTTLVHTPSTTSTATQPMLAELPLTSGQEAILKDIILSVAKKNYLQLGFDAFRLKAAWKKLGVIHPLRVLFYIYTTPELAQAMKSICKDSLKKLIKGDLADQLSLSNESCEPYLDEFVAAVQVPRADIEASISKNDWKTVIDSLTNQG